MLTLVIGGVRSGKSRFAQSLCPLSASPVYVATARPDDEEMRARIERHRRQRPAGWATVEEPLDITGAVRRAATCSGVILLDCLTVWLSNFCFERRDKPAEAIEHAACEEVGLLSDAADGRRLIVVTNEVGCGIVPETPLGRRFRDLLGLVNQTAACRADVVYQMMAGIPITIKGSTEVPR